MTSREVVTAALIVGLLAVAPVAAQRQRNPGGGGGGGSRSGGQNGGGQGGGRQVAAPQGRGARAQGGRIVEQPRQYATPPQAAGQRSGSATTRYAVPREQAYAGRSYDNRTSVAPRYGNPVVSGTPVPPRGGSVNVDRRRNPGYTNPGYSNPGYINRGYAGRYVDPGYGVRPGYGARPGYAVPRSYAVPRGYVAPRGYAYGYGHHRGYYGPPRYVAPGWRGTGYVVMTPRYISPYILGYGVWQPYYYRPSIGLGVYYGADGLYPFGAVPPAYYDPAPTAVYGGLRITDAPRDAQVFADGNYVGIVDDFDGASQHLNLEPGQHRIEVHAPGLTPIAFDVVVEPGRTITLRAEIY